MPNPINVVNAASINGEPVILKSPPPPCPPTPPGLPGNATGRVSSAPSSPASFLFASPFCCTTRASALRAGMLMSTFWRGLLPNRGGLGGGLGGGGGLSVVANRRNVEARLVTCGKGGNACHVVGVFGRFAICATRKCRWCRIRGHQRR